MGLHDPVSNGGRCRKSISSLLRHCFAVERRSEFAECAKRLADGQACRIGDDH